MRRTNIFTLSPVQINCTLKKQYTTLFECYKKSFNKVDINSQEGEVVLYVFHKHWFVNFHWILISSFLFIFPAFILPLLDSNYFNIKYKIAITAFWYLFLGIYVFESFLDWFFDSYVITTNRVICIDFTNYINKKISEANICNIQDISTRISGVSQTFLDYGTVRIQTASAKEMIIFQNISHPEDIAQIIDKLRLNCKITKGGINE